MGDQLAQVVREKILAELDRAATALTPREVRRPRVSNKALAVIGMRRC